MPEESKYPQKAAASSLSPKSLAIELASVVFCVVIATHLLYAARQSLGSYLAVIVAVILLYVPMLALWIRKRSADFLDKDLRGVLKGVLTFLVAAVIVFPVFFAAAHVWQELVFGVRWRGAASLPNAANFTLYQLFLVALPEEFFFRGYFQSTADVIFKRRVRFIGANIGWGLVVTAVVFALAHTFITYRWWHFSIFFPALLFGWLRARTGSITAPCLFHAASNVLIEWFARCYG